MEIGCREMTRNIAGEPELAAVGKYLVESGVTPN